MNSMTQLTVQRKYLAGSMGLVKVFETELK